MNKKNLIIVGAIVGLFVVVLGVIAVLGFKTPNEASKHLKTVLDHRFKGDVKSRMELVEDETEEELYAQYEESVRSFVKANVLSGAEVDAETEDKYVEQCKKMFAVMKYEVGKSKKTNENEYRVTVTYQPSDFFMKFMTAADGETQRILEKYENSEYRGTEEEINRVMKEEFLENALVMFEEACNSMEYGEEKTMVFTITKSKNGVYRVNADEIVEFTMKILRLDEIQD